MSYLVAWEGERGVQTPHACVFCVCARVGFDAVAWLAADEAGAIALDELIGASGRLVRAGAPIDGERMASKASSSESVSPYWKVVVAACVCVGSGESSLSKDTVAFSSSSPSGDSTIPMPAMRSWTLMPKVNMRFTDGRASSAGSNEDELESSRTSRRT